MMFTKADIRRVGIVIPKSDYREFIVRLGRSGFIQIDRDIKDESAGSEKNIAMASIAADTAIAQSIAASASEFLSGTDHGADEVSSYDSILEDIPSLFSRDQAADLRDADHIKMKKNQYIKVRAMIEKQIESADLRLAEIRILSGAGIDLPVLQSMKYISCIYGTISNTDRLNDIDEKWFYIINGNRLLLLLPAEAKDNALKILRESGFDDLIDVIKTEHSIDGAEKAAADHIKDLNRKLARLDEYYNSKLPLWAEKMAYLQAVYSVILKITGAESALRFSDEIIVINGWVDLRDADALERVLHDSCGEHFYINIATRAENRRFRGRIPILLKNSRLFRPFELLVRMMGFPGNSEVDPTPLAAIAYVIIFGVMFGDAGQGLVLIAAGYILNRYGMKKHQSRNNISDFGTIMIWCGISAVTFGFLYGSVFSYEHLLPALLFHPMENMMQLFLMAIMMGVVFISSGLILNIINGIIAGHYGESFFGTRGAAGLAVYVSFIFFVMRYIFSGVFPDAVELAASVVLPAVLFCIRGPLDYILFHGEKFFPHGLFEYTVESIIEIIEMFSGFLGNTISFIRAGAFALSHAGLSIAVFTLAGIVNPSMMSAGSVTVIVFGNIFIIALEGLVCAIQSMRLEYYEFFGKFFKGDGIGFTPFSLRFNR